MSYQNDIDDIGTNDGFYLKKRHEWNDGLGRQQRGQQADGGSEAKTRTARGIQTAWAHICMHCAGARSSEARRCFLAAGGQRKGKVPLRGVKILISKIKQDLIKKLSNHY